MRMDLPGLRIPFHAASNISGMLLASIFCLLLGLSCAPEPEPGEPPVEHLFTLMPPARTGVQFENRLSDESQFNVFKYRNYYNGGGVAIGDVNNDGLPDIYLTANRLPNRLYLNQGNFRFKDVTRQAGVSGKHAWSTGACLVDINADGLLDIYLCNSGNLPGDDRANELFVNLGPDDQGIPRFREEARKWGLDDRGFSTHALFFDYDRDGDLDVYLLNNAFRPLSTFDLSVNLRREADQTGGGDRLYRNEGGHFREVTGEAGLYSSVIAFGLGVAASDFNNDGWLDLYVANDFFERDYLYLNNGDGTFREVLEEMLQHVSLSSMGMDVGDVNHDGWMDIFTTDMLPENDYRLKTTFVFDEFDFIEKQVEWGYYYQYSQNALQVSNGFNPFCGLTFSDLAWLAGVAATDWTWSALLLDMDNDGWQDIFVTNGIFRDVTDQDYLALLMQRENIRRILQGEKIDFPELIRQMPSTPLANYAFRQVKPLRFQNMAREWGLDTLSFSNGAAYGDLDLDGDLDLVVNNVNQPAFLFRNESDTLLGHHYLQIQLRGEGGNPFAVGALVEVYVPRAGKLIRELIPMRGFQSSMDYLLTFGLGTAEQVDSVIVIWPDGRRTRLEAVAANQRLILRQSEATEAEMPATPLDAGPAAPLLKKLSGKLPLAYRHRENRFVDFQREPLLPRKLSMEGPPLAVGDVNGDGLEDVFVGAAKSFPARLFMQNARGQFSSQAEKLWEKSRLSEDVDAAFFDADRDGDLDLYVVSGGNEYSRHSPALMDRFYRNQGRGRLIEDRQALPARFYASGSCVAPADFDGDGDVDLFVGGRSIPWQYGMDAPQFLLANNGRGQFQDVTEQWAPELQHAGMVTDALWWDYQQDGDLDLVLVGEWMPVTLFKNEAGKLVNVTDQAGLAGTEGWWNCVTIADLDGDGLQDLIAGNFGLNFKLKASPEEPVQLYVADFDRNGTIDPILCYTRAGRHIPFPLRSDLLQQLPGLKQRLPTHASYAGKSVEEIFQPEELSRARIKQVTTFASTVFFQNPDGTFQAVPLPEAAQISPVFSILVRDLNLDGLPDLILGGNFFGATPQLARQDASHGTVLLSRKTRKFVVVPVQESGFCLRGQVRDMAILHWKRKTPLLLVARNNDSLAVFQIQKQAGLLPAPVE